MRILLPYSGVSVMLFYLILGSPLASSHHSLRKICQDISYSWEQETWHLYILICSLHLSKTFEYSLWVLATAETEQHQITTFQWTLNVSPGKTGLYKGKVRIFKFFLPFLCSNPLLVYEYIAYVDRKVSWGGLFLVTSI